MLTILKKCDIIKKTKNDEDYGIVTVKKYREIDAK
jgi:hypothetical protein